MTEDRKSQRDLSEEEKAERRAKNAANRARREAKAAERAAAPAAEKPKKQKPAKAEKQNAEAATAQDNPQTLSPPAPSLPESRRQPFNILVIAQAGRLEFETALFAESLRANAPDWRGRLVVAEPMPDAAWSGHHTRIKDATREALLARGAEITPFTAKHFGASYPHGNKIEALASLPENENFIFFDSDTLITGPLDRQGFDFSRPSASMRREGTWPLPPLYGPGYADIWRSLYDRFDLDFEGTLDLSQPDEHWERFLYFNAGWFFGADPAEFGRRYLSWALAIRNDPGEALAAQVLDPWLDQVALPLVIHSFGGGRPGPDLSGMDSEITCHWRKLPLIYAREQDCVVDALEKAAHVPDIRKLLEGWEPARRLIYEGNGRKTLRPMFDRDHLPKREQMIRQKIKRAGWWLV